MAVNLSSQDKQILYENRFCNQENFDIIISGNHNNLANTEVRSTFRISYPEFKTVETLNTSRKHNNTETTICERSDIWTISNIYIQNRTDVRIGSSIPCLDKKDQWINMIQLPVIRTTYCACSFMKSLYVFGGFN